MHNEEMQQIKKEYEEKIEKIENNQKSFLKKIQKENDGNKDKEISIHNQTVLIRELNEQIEQ